MIEAEDRAPDRLGRRLILGVGAAAAVYVDIRFAMPRVAEVFAPDFEFEALREPAGFRRIDGGASTAEFDPFFELSGDATTRAESHVADVGTRVCDALFGDEATGGDLVPVASFSDYNCPFCRVLTVRLARIEAAAPRRIRMSWHELPLLGDASMTAARGALAAKRQGTYLAFHRRLMNSRFQTTPDYLATLAQDLGVDAERLANDMQSDAITKEIANSLALARIFGFIGTPALVVGRTVVQGEISEPRLERLIERERADGPLAACA